MLFDDTYKTISTPSEGLYKEKGSKFIAYAFPVKTEVEIKEHISRLKKEHHSARHHCYAYRLHPDKSVYRMNDDGEPSGTAGKPIYGQIQSNDLTNILIVVVRYFGGTLLGVGGLIKAYRSAASDAINNCSIINETVNELYKVSCNYDHQNDVIRIIKQENLKIMGSQSDNKFVITFEVRRSKAEKVIKSIKLIQNCEIKFISNV
jgi:uncharacterized YigZ family protein